MCCTVTCSRRVGLILLLSAFVCIIGSILLFFPDFKQLENDEIAGEVWLMGGIIIGGGLFMLSFLFCSAFGLLGYMYSIGVALAGLALGLKWLADRKWQSSFADPPTNSSNDPVNEILCLICEFPENIVMWNLVLFSILLIVGVLQLQVIISCLGCMYRDRGHSKWAFRKCYGTSSDIGEDEPPTSSTGQDLTSASSAKQASSGMVSTPQDKLPSMSSATSAQLEASEMPASEPLLSPTAELQPTEPANGLSPLTDRIRIELIQRGPRKCCYLVGLILLLSVFVCIFAIILLLSPNSKQLENDQITGEVWLMGGIIIGGGLFMLLSVFCSAFGLLGYMFNAGVASAGLALGLKWLVNSKWQSPFADLLTNNSGDPVNQILCLICEFPKNILMWNVVLFSILLIVGVVQLVLYWIKVNEDHRYSRWKCCCLVGLILLLSAFVCIIASILLFFTHVKPQGHDQTAGLVWLMGGIFIGLGLFILRPSFASIRARGKDCCGADCSGNRCRMRNSVFCSALGLLGSMLNTGVASAGLALGLKWLVDWQYPFADPSANSSSYLVNQILWLIYKFHKNIVMWNVVLYSILLIVGVTQLVLYGIQVINGCLGCFFRDHLDPEWAFQKCHGASSDSVKEEPPTSSTGQELTSASPATQDSSEMVSTAQDEQRSVSSTTQKSSHISPSTCDIVDEDMVASTCTQQEPSVSGTLPDHVEASADMVKEEPPISPTVQDLPPASSAPQVSSETVSTTQDEVPSEPSTTQKSSQNTPPTCDIKDKHRVDSTSEWNETSVSRTLPEHVEASSDSVKEKPCTPSTGQDLPPAASAKHSSSEMVSTPQNEPSSGSSTTEKSPQISPPTSDIEDEDRVHSTSERDETSVQNLHGLHNQGSTCYLNSVLQVLFRTEDFREAVERHCHENTAGGNCLDCRLQSLFKELKWRTGRTHSITKCLGVDRVYEQQDAAEYFEKILSLTSPDVSQVFHGLLTHSIICSSCGTEMDSDGLFWHLPLALVDSDSELYSVVNGIKDYFREKHFRGQNQLYCDSCHAKSDAFTKRVIKNHPEVLMLLLKRFTLDYKYMEYVKINSDVIIPETLQIPENQSYELYAVVDHFGSLRGGHYTATINVNGEWYTFNDSSVTKTPPVSITSSSAYLLFYKKTKEMPATEPSPSSSAEDELLSNDPADRRSPLTDSIETASSWPKKVWTGLVNVTRFSGPLLDNDRTSSAIVEDDPPTSPTGQDLTSASSDTQDSSGKVSTPQDELPSMSSAPQKSSQISPPTSDVEDEAIVVSTSTQHKPSEMPAPEPSLSPSAEDELQSTDPRNCPSPLSDSIETEPVQKSHLDHDRTSSAIVEDNPPTSPTGQDLTSVSSDTQTDSSGKASTPQDELPSISSATQKSPQISSPTSDIEDEAIVVSTSTQHKPSEIPAPEPSLSPSADVKPQSTDPADRQSPLSDSIETEPVHREAISGALQDHDRTSSATGEDDPPTSPTGKDLTSASSDTQDSSGIASTPQDERPPMSSTTQKSPQISPPTSDIEDEDLGDSTSTKHGTPEMPAPEPSLSPSAEDELQSTDPADRQTPQSDSIETELVEREPKPLLDHDRTSSATGEDDPPTSPTGQDLTSASSATQTDSSGKVSTPQDELPSVSSTTQKSPQISPPTSDSEDEDLVASSSAQPKPSEMAGPEPSPSPSAEDELQSTDPRNCPSPLSDSIETESVQREQRPLLDHDRTSSATGEDDPPTSPTGKDLTSASSDTQDSSGIASTPQDELPSMSSTTQKSPQISPPTSDIEDEDLGDSTSTQHGTPEMPAPEPSPSPSAEDQLLSTDPADRQTPQSDSIETELVEREPRPLLDHDRTSSATVEDDPPTSPTGQDLTSVSSDTQTDSSGKVSTPQDELPSMSSATQKSPQISPSTSDIEDEAIVVSTSTQHEPSEIPAPEPSLSPSSEDELQSNDPADRQTPQSDSIETEPIQREPRVLQDHAGASSATVEDDPPTSPTGQDLTSASSDTQDSSGKVSTPQDEPPSMSSATQKSPQISPPTSDIEDEAIVVSTSTQHEPSEMTAPEPSPSPSAEDELLSTDPADRQTPWTGMVWTKLPEVGRWPLLDHDRTSSAIGEDDPPTSPTGQDLTSASSDTQDSSGKVSTPQDELPSMSSAPQKSPQISPPTSDIEDEAIVVSSSTQHEPSAAPSSKENKTYQVIVTGLRGEEMIIDLCNTEEQMQKVTVLQLKEKILQRLPGHDDVACLVLIFADEMLDGDSTLLCSYGIQHLSVIHVVIRLAQSSSPTSNTEDEDSDASSSTQPEPSAAPSSNEIKTYQVIVNGPRGEEMIIDLCNTEEQMQNMTVLQLKEKIIQRVPGHDDVERLRLIFTDRMLDGDSTLLCSYGIHHKSVIHLVMRLPGGGSSPSPFPPPSRPRRKSIQLFVSFQWKSHGTYNA
ncbi:uncharacterized protein V6R79_006801 [Siganus canaliculatus]